MKPPSRVLKWCLALAATGVLAAGAWWLKPRDDVPPDPPGPAWFADATGDVKLDFRHDAGPLGAFFMPQALGSGAALFDFDGDGRLDLYLLQNGGPKSSSTNRLFRQNDDGQFDDVSTGSGLDIAGHNMGVAIGDIDNDGDPDVLVTQYLGVKLFRNNGDRTFTDITDQAGLHNPAWGMSAAFFDFDRDGWLDLVVVNYVDYDPTWPCTTPNGRPEYCSPQTFPGRVSKLFRNLGKNADGAVRFEDVTLKSGLGSVPGPGLGVACADFDGDDWPDIFIANDGKPNRLWINQRNGTFRDEAVARGIAFNAMGKAEAGMGVALGDADNDGMLDCYVTHLGEETNTLWKQGPRGLFRDVTVVSQLAGTRWRGTGFGTVFGDFDHDGYLDLAVANGRIARADTSANPALGAHWGHYAERNQLLANLGDGRFRDVSRDNAALCGAANVARGLALGDLDNDGALDLVVTTAAGPARVLKNIKSGTGHWLLLRAVDPALKRDAYGAEIRGRAGDRKWLRVVQPASSYLCSSDVRVHVGLGEAVRYDRIEVTWPDGSSEEYAPGSTNRQITLVRGQGAKINKLAD